VTHVARVRELADIEIDGWATRLASTPDGKTLARVAGGSPIRLVDLSNGKEVGTLTGHADVVQAPAFSRDGARLASGSRDGTIRFWGVGQ
jgi:WD40 repeat protein